MSGYIQSISPSSSLDLNQTEKAFPTVYDALVVDDMEGGPEEETEIERSISYADTTRILVDETDRNTLKSLGSRKIRSWTGKDLRKVFEGIGRPISIRDARMINQKAGKRIIKLNTENIERFPVDQFIFERLGHIDLTQASKELGLRDWALHEFKAHRINTILKEKAEKYNDQFNKMHKLPRAEVFDLKRIFQLALEEPIFDKEKKLSEQTLITIEDSHRNALNQLPDREKFLRWIGKKFSSFCQLVKTISIKNAVLIHKISGKIIFTFNREAVVKIPILPVHLEELERLRQEFNIEDKKLDRQIRKKITVFKHGDQNCIDQELAKKINSYFQTEVFDYESILAQAVREAKDEVEKMEFSPLSKKRPRTEDSSVPNSKKQRTGEETAHSITLRAPDFEAATSLEMLLTTGETAKSAPKSKHDLGFLLN